jgi:hypothetical protein
MTLYLTIATLVILAYLAGFVLLTRKASKAAGRNVDEFAEPEGAQRWTALLFRLGFVGGGLWGIGRALVPGLSPAWPEGLAWLTLPALALALAGAWLALAAQAQMAASWRIGAVEGTVGAPTGSLRFPAIRCLSAR